MTQYTLASNCEPGDPSDFARREPFEVMSLGEVLAELNAPHSGEAVAETDAELFARIRRWCAAHPPITPTGEAVAWRISLGRCSPLLTSDSRDARYYAERGFIVTPLAPITTGSEGGYQQKVYAWLGRWRDFMPFDAVHALQDILGPLSTAPSAPVTTGSENLERKSRAMWLREAADMVDAGQEPWLPDHVVRPAPSAEYEAAVDDVLNRFQVGAPPSAPVSGDAPQPPLSAAQGGVMSPHTVGVAFTMGMPPAPPSAAGAFIHPTDVTGRFCAVEGCQVHALSPTPAEGDREEAARLCERTATMRRHSAAQRGLMAGEYERLSADANRFDLAAAALRRPVVDEGMVERLAAVLANAEGYEIGTYTVAHKARARTYLTAALAGEK